MTVILLLVSVWKNIKLYLAFSKKASQWRQNDHDGISNHQLHDCLLKLLFMRISKKTSKLRVTGFCEGISLGTGEFPAQRVGNAENVSTDDVIMWDVVNDTCPYFNGG